MQSLEKEISKPDCDDLEKKARQAGEAIIRRYCLEAVWPSENPDQTRALVLRMCNTLAKIYDRDVTAISIDDLERAQDKLKALLGKVGISRLRYSSITRSLNLYKKTENYVNIFSYVYSVGAACSGNFGPIVRKFGLKYSGAPLARSSGVWLAGQVALEIYYDEKGYQKAQKAIIEFDPLFDSFGMDRLRDLALYLNIDAKLKWDEERLRKEIFGILSNSYYNKVQKIWAEPPSYKNILFNLCSELQVPKYEMSESVEDLEGKIVRKVFADNVKDIPPEKLKEYETLVRSQMADRYWKDGSKSLLMTGALVGGRLSGLGLYLAASSGLASISGGVGLAAFSSMTSALGLLFGPVSIGLAGAFAAFQLTKARPKQSLPFVLYMAIMRSHLQMESARKISFIKKIIHFFNIVRWFRRLKSKG